MRRYSILIAAVLLLTLAGCGWGRGSNQPGHHVTVGDTLISIGQIGMWAGSGAIACGVMALVACAWPLLAAYLLPFKGLFVELIAIGVATLLLGASAIWLGTHAWLLAIVVVLVIAGLGFRYRGRIARFLGIPRKPSTPKVGHA